MIAAQAMAAHHASMECSRRANACRTTVRSSTGPPQGRGERVPHIRRAAIGAGAQTRQRRATEGDGGAYQGGQAIVGNVQGGDAGAETKPAPPLAIGQEQSGMTLEDLIGKQPELVGREGMTDNPTQNPMPPVGNRLRHGVRGGDPRTAPRCGARTRAHTPCKGPAMPNGRCRIAPAHGRRRASSAS